MYEYAKNSKKLKSLEIIAKYENLQKKVAQISEIADRVNNVSNF
jgi:hypothetical protein